MLHNFKILMKQVILIRMLQINLRFKVLDLQTFSFRKIMMNLNKTVLMCLDMLIIGVEMHMILFFLQMVLVLVKMSN
jgi:hypothetical protein